MKNEQTNTSESKAMTLTPTSWFPTVIYAGLNENVDCKFLKETALYWQSVEPAPTYSMNSNDGGWHSRSIEIIDAVEDKLKDGIVSFKNELDNVIEEVRKEMGFPELKFQNFWININGYGASHKFHNHPESLLSGVFYIDIPNDNTSNIEFQRNDVAEYYIPQNLKSYNHITCIEATYKPQTGLMLVFPSWTRHGVTTNKGNGNRIAVSFNYGVVTG